MDYKSIWNEICFHVDKNRYATEQDFEKVVELLFEKLGWSSYRGEIEMQREVNIGSSRVARLDIILKDDGKDVLVVELKRVGAGISERNADQLAHYMRILKLDYGILLGETLQIYCELPDSDNSPVRLCNIGFNENSESGVECIEVLSRNGFSFDRLQEFSIKCLADQSKYVEKTSFKSHHRPFPDSTKTTGTASSKELNWDKKSSKHGFSRKGRFVYEYICQHKDDILYVGLKTIELSLRAMSRHDIDITQFHLNNQVASHISDSWISGQRFIEIYESK